MPSATASSCGAAMTGTARFAAGFAGPAGGASTTGTCLTSAAAGRAAACAGGAACRVGTTCRARDPPAPVPIPPLPEDPPWGAPPVAPEPPEPVLPPEAVPPASPVPELPLVEHARKTTEANTESTDLPGTSRRPHGLVSIVDKVPASGRRDKQTREAHATIGQRHASFVGSELIGAALRRRERLRKARSRGQSYISVCIVDHFARQTISVGRVVHSGLLHSVHDSKLRAGLRRLRTRTGSGLTPHAVDSAASC